jgi:hypothetical protein
MTDLSEPRARLPHHRSAHAEISYHRGDGVPDGVDCFPLDPARSACLVSDPNDHTPLVITLIAPIGARKIS